jgi:hypothetical protein
VTGGQSEADPQHAGLALCIARTVAVPYNSTVQAMGAATVAFLGGGMVSTATAQQKGKVPNGQVSIVFDGGFLKYVVPNKLAGSLHTLTSLLLHSRLHQLVRRRQ